MAQSDSSAPAFFSDEPKNVALYRALGLEPNCTSRQIKLAYHKLALRYHPDKATSSSDGERFHEISTAYTLLSDPRKRQLYDQFGEQGVHMVEMMSQRGLPSWIFLPAAQVRRP